MELSTQDYNKLVVYYPILRFFRHDHLAGKLKEVSAKFQVLAWDIAFNSPKNAETSTALRKILEAKDCAIRAILPE